MLDLAPLRRPDAGTIDALARLQLAARRSDGELRLGNATGELVELIGLAGLADVLPVEPGGQPEAREERGSVEKEGELPDPPARELDDL